VPWSRCRLSALHSGRGRGPARDPRCFGDDACWLLRDVVHDDDRALIAVPHQITRCGKVRPTFYRGRSRSHDVSHPDGGRVGCGALFVHAVTVAATLSASPQERARVLIPGPRAGRSGGRRRASRLAHRPEQLLPGGDVEFREHLAQVPLDRPRADEQLGADLGICQALAGEAADVPLLRG
jgi:hypothetical protein